MTAVTRFKHANKFLLGPGCVRTPLEAFCLYLNSISNCFCWGLPSSSTIRQFTVITSNLFTATLVGVLYEKY